MTFNTFHCIDGEEQRCSFGVLCEAEAEMWACNTIDELRAAAMRYCRMMDQYYANYGTIYLEGVEWDNRRRENA